MDEKIKIIKDIEKYIAFWFVTQEAITDYKAEVEEEIKERKRAYATALYNAGYRKIPENAVVLTREEYDKIYEQAEATVLSNIADGGTSCHWCMDEHEKIGYEKGCKETAEKFAGMAEQKSVYFNLNGTIYKAVHIEDINEICKEMLISECQSEMQDTTTVDLPCKIGATVYLPWEYGGVSAVANLTVTHIILTREKSYVVTDFETDDNGYWEKYKGGQYNFDDFGKIIFTKESKAKQRLNEKI